jgi:hypothetical protein
MNIVAQRQDLFGRLAGRRVERVELLDEFFDVFEL